MTNDDSAMSVFTHEFSVTDEMIDGNHHVNNVVYLQWMQDLAVEHSKAAVPAGLLTQLGLTWVARSHHIEYLSPAFSSDHVIARTWLTGFRRVRCCRQYEFIRVSDSKLLARGETDWVCVDRDDGRPRSIPDEIRVALPVRTVDD